MAEKGSGVNYLLNGGKQRKMRKRRRERRRGSWAVEVLDSFLRTGP